MASKVRKSIFFNFISLDLAGLSSPKNGRSVKKLPDRSGRCEIKFKICATVFCNTVSRWKRCV